MKTDAFHHWLGCVSMMAILLCAAPSGVHAEPSLPFRIGFSKTVVGDVNENDALAAVRVWAQALARDRAIPADPRPVIFRNVDEMAAALTDRAVDCLNLTAYEYFALGTRVDRENVVVGIISGSIMVEYLLLVHQKSGMKDIDHLKGRSLGLLDSLQASMAHAWLDTLLAAKGRGCALDFFERIASVKKTDKAILPVFFRQVDACVVTRSGFETMKELNPQIGQQLKAIAVSPPVVPVVFCFRADFDSLVRKKILNEITQWHLFPAGMQILTIFQTDRLEQHPASCLDSASELLTAHERVSAENKATLGEKTRGKGEGGTR